MQALKLNFLLVPLVFLSHVESANIFIHIGALTSHSPTASIQPLADKLAERGHQVTIFSPIIIPTRHPSIKTFCPKALLEEHRVIMKKMGDESAQEKSAKEMDAGSFSKLVFGIFDIAIDMCQTLVKQPELNDLLEKEKFDLFIIDSVVNECGYPLAYHFKAKTIVYGTMGTAMPWDIQTFGLPSELSWVPGFASSFAGGQLSFLDRIGNTFTIFMLSSIYRSYFLPKIGQAFKDSKWNTSFTDMPPVEELVQNASLMLLNQHYSDQFPRGYPPFVVTVGGMHVLEPNSTIPKDIQKFIGNDNFIFVSFGTFIRVSAMPQDTVQKFFDAFGSSKFKFLWKWEGTPPENTPKNILFREWFPQQNLLAHPKISGFLTQGGQISITQGLCHGVPLIICPVDADQHFNAMRSVETGNGFVLDLSGITRPKLEDALHRLQTDKILAERARKMKTACRDRPMKPVDKAVWWTEWVLRTDDASLLLKPSSAGISLWYHLCLDIWSLVFGLIFSISSIFLIVLYKLIKCLSKRGHSSSKVKTN